MRVLEFENLFSANSLLFHADRPKNAINLIRKKLSSDNPNTVIYALQVSESFNCCRAGLHDAFASVGSKTLCFSMSWQNSVYEVPRVHRQKLRVKSTQWDCDKIVHGHFEVNISRNYYFFWTAVTCKTASIFTRQEVFANFFLFHIKPQSDLTIHLTESILICIFRNFKSKPEPIKTKILELIQCWSFAFRKNANYKIVEDYYNAIKIEGLFIHH